MNKKRKIPFTRLSSNFEIILPEDLNTLKGGGDSDDWQGSPGSPDDPKELPEVVVTPDPEEEEEDPAPDPLPEHDPIETNPDPDDPDFEFPPDGDEGGWEEEPEEEREDLPEICFTRLKNAYPPPNADGTAAHPSADGYENQCAIRVGKALHDSYDIDFHGYYEKTFGPISSEGYPRGSKSLADYLEREFINDHKTVHKMSQEEFENSEYYHKSGIIYLAPPPGGVGHIDIFENGAVGSGYYTASEVWFFEFNDDPCNP
jgi:hypothetical protein